MLSHGLWPGREAYLDAAIGNVADFLAVELGPLLAMQLLHQRDDVLRPHLREQKTTKKNHR